MTTNMFRDVGSCFELMNSRVELKLQFTIAGLSLDSILVYVLAFFLYIFLSLVSTIVRVLGFPSIVVLNLASNLVYVLSFPSIVATSLQRLLFLVSW
jgi:uncharacterized membrane-anchored protein